MTTSTASIVFGFALLAAAAGAVAARGQEYTGRPGDPTQARVWVQNTPLSVTVAGTPTVALSSSTQLQAKLARQNWEYRIVAIAAGEDAARAINRAGAEGWEAVGVIPASDGASVLLKRPN
jgi:hypothetical protein